MNSEIKVYGFGSYFYSRKSYRDIDILIVHESETLESCMKAIKLKGNILSGIKGVHVSILSRSSEVYFDFVSTSRAILLGKIDESDLLSSVKKIHTKLSTFRKT